MALAQNLPEHRQPFLAPVLFIARNQDDILAVSFARRRVINDPGLLRGRDSKDEQSERQSSAPFQQVAQFHRVILVQTTPAAICFREKVVRPPAGVVESEKLSN